MWSKYFWLATGERALKSFAQGVIMSWVGSNYTGANLYDLDPVIAFGAGGGMAVLSILFSVASAPASKTDGPSLFDTEKLPNEPKVPGT